MADPAGTAAYGPSDALRYAAALLGGHPSGPNAAALRLAADICRLVLAHCPITSAAIGANLRKEGATAEPQSEIDAAAAGDAAQTAAVAAHASPVAHFARTAYPARSTA